MCKRNLLIWKTPAKLVLSQYDFRRAIVLKWLGVERQSADRPEEEEEGPQPKRRKSDAVSLSACSTEMSQGKRATYVTDASLDQINGSLRERLNEFADHYPERSKLKAPCCSLCRLVDNQKFYTGVVCCDICKVHLCIDCAIKRLIDSRKVFCNWISSSKDISFFYKPFRDFFVRFSLAPVAAFRW